MSDIGSSARSFGEDLNGEPRPGGESPPNAIPRDTIEDGTDQREARSDHTQELLDFLAENRMSQAELARRTGYSRQTIYNLINGVTQINARTSSALGRVTSHEPDYWLRRQQESQKLEEGSVIHLGQPTSAVGNPAHHGTGDTTLVDFQISNLIERCEIEISPVPEPEQIQPCSIDLRYSGYIFGKTKPKSTAAKSKDEKAGRFSLSDAEETGPIKLAKSESVVLVTHERVTLPSNFLGRLGVPADFLVQGIVGHVGLHVDPGYDGRLVVLFVNCGPSAVNIHPMDVILSLELQRLEVTPQKDLGDLTNHGIVWLHDYLTAAYRASSANQQIHVHSETDEQGRERYEAFLPGVDFVSGTGATRDKACEDLVAEILSTYDALLRRRNGLNSKQVADMKKLQSIVGKEPPRETTLPDVTDFCIQFALELDETGLVFPKRGDQYLKHFKLRPKPSNKEKWYAAFCETVGKPVSELKEWLRPDRGIDEFDEWAGWRPA